MHNDYQELSKKDKKIVRELIDKGIAEDFRKGMQHFDQLIQQLKISAETPQEQYYKLFNEVQDFDKQIGGAPRRAARIGLPAYSNEVILMLKASALASTVTLLELTGMARTIIARTYLPVEIFFAAGVFYLVMAYVLVRGFKLLERWLRVDACQGR